MVTAATARCTVAALPHRSGRLWPPVADAEPGQDPGGQGECDLTILTWPLTPRA
ncbi:hypothetical protein ACRAWD_11370 [Caulobacter segnis]